jgi:hypothetical protein
VDFHIDWQAILTALAQFPVLLVVFGGLLFGTAWTQTIKQAWAAFWPGQMAALSCARYTFTVRILAVSSTYLFTLLLWHRILQHSGIDEVASLGVGGVSPYSYQLTKRFVEHHWPWLADRMGAGPPNPPNGGPPT